MILLHLRAHVFKYFLTSFNNSQIEAFSCKHFLLLWFQQLKLNKEKKKLHNDVFVRIFKNNEEVFFGRNLSGIKSANLWRLKIFLKFLTHKFYNAKKYSSEELYNKVLQKFSISQFLLFKKYYNFFSSKSTFCSVFQKSFLKLDKFSFTGLWIIS